MNIWWVSQQDGSDDTGDGSRTTPYATIEKALTVFQNTDQIRLLDGTYTPVDSVIFSGLEGSLFSENPQGSYIQPQKTDSHVACVAVLSSPRFSLIGINVLQASDIRNNLIGIYAADVENFVCMTCVVSNFEVPSGTSHGIYAAGDGRLQDCKVESFAGAGPTVFGIRTKGVDIIDCGVVQLSAINDAVVYEMDGLRYG